MMADHATHEEGGHGIEAGVLEMLERMQTGRLKVFRGLEDWLGEFRLYHRNKGSSSRSATTFSQPLATR